jgi:lincosamide nucleotidyltransferase A/C/D/E
MHLDEVERVLHELDDQSIRYWLVGGWGVDALVGRQTRAHRDLDLAVDADQWEICVAQVQALGYELETDWLPIRVELASPSGWVDLHPVRFNPSGDGVQAGPDGTTYDYPSEHLATGLLNGRTVPCISARWQVKAHSGYEPRPQDLHDLEMLGSLLD